MSTGQNSADFAWCRQFIRECIANDSALRLRRFPTFLGAETVDDVKRIAEEVYKMTDEEWEALIQRNSDAITGPPEDPEE